MIVQLSLDHFEIGTQHLGLVPELKKIKAIIELCVKMFIMMNSESSYTT